MHLQIENVPKHLDMIKFAEIEPGFILMVLIWLFSSFFSKKKKKNQDLSKKTKLSDKFENLLSSLDNLANVNDKGSRDVDTTFNVDLNTQSNKNQNQKDESEIVFSDEYYDDNFYSTDDLGVEGVDYDEGLVSPVPKAEPQKQNIPTSKTVTKSFKIYGTPIQKVMILKEILDKPRGLNPYKSKKYE